MDKIASAISSAGIWIYWGLVFVGVNIQCSHVKANTLRVLMIDAGTPFYQDYPEYIGKDVSLDWMRGQTHFHSDAMFQFITNRNECPSYTIDWCNYHHKTETSTVVAYNHCLSKMNDYDIVNMSLAGESFNAEEARFITETTRPILVIAAGNEGMPRLDFPALYTYTQSNVYAIAALDLLGNRLDSSNYDKKAIDWLGVSGYNTRDGKVRSLMGTSVAAALYTNKLIKELCPSKAKKGIRYE